MSYQARKRFGQNFLHDPTVISRIVRSINPLPGEAVVEIGPGLGALTTELLKACGELDVVELDRDIIPLLEATCAGLGKLHIHQADALRFDFTKLAAGRRLRVVGNLPYNISTPLLFHLLDQAACVADMHFMLQKEVVDRMAASAGGSDYGRLSVMLAWRCEVEPLFVVGPGAFNPPPKVHSAVVRLIPHTTPPFQVTSPELFNQVVSQAFSRRRKTLRNALSGLIGANTLSDLAIDSIRRPETLAPAEFAAIANAIALEK